MKKNLLFALLFIVVFLSFSGIANIFSNTGIKIESFIADITVEDNGDMVVSEEVTFKYPEGYTVNYRDIAYNKYNSDNPLYQSPLNRAYFDKESVSVWVKKDDLLLNPSTYQFKQSGERDERGVIIECPASKSECNSIFVRVPSGFGKQMTFGYNYRIRGAVTKYSDTAELNWRLLGGEGFTLDSNIKNVEINITLPGVANEDILTWAHGTDGTVDIVNNQVLLKVKNMKQSDWLEFRILMPGEHYSVSESNQIERNMRQEIIDYQTELAIETNRRITIAQVVFYGTFGMLVLMVIFIYIAYVKYDKEHTPKFAGKYYRELPADYSPAEMSYLYHFRKLNDEDLTATLLDLVRRKYLILDQNNEGINEKDPDFKFILNPEMDRRELKAHERHLLTWFIDVIGDKKEVSIDQIEAYPKISYESAISFQNNSKTFVRVAKAEGSKHDFFEKRLGQEKSRMYIAAVVPIFYILLSLFLGSAYSIDNTFSIIVSFAALIVYIIYIASIKKRSINGNEDYVKWKAFKEFLLDFGNMKDYPIPGIVVWEHYLVYATSLKVADKVMEQLRVKLPKVDEQELSNSTYLGFGYYYPRYRFYYTFSRINSSISTARLNQTQTIVKHNSAKVGGGGGFGRGGGFGGGSSFGGGGGGFRSR
ncbi:MAG: DUF2207 domain-containing protein [Bacilli bacterium]|nr:DUF2207 domain-containing protein [Bacilli bacterium]